MVSWPEFAAHVASAVPVIGRTNGQHVRVTLQLSNYVSVDFRRSVLQVRRNFILQYHKLKLRSELLVFCIVPLMRSCRVVPCSQLLTVQSVFCRQVLN
jgi:hypothetical protein